MSSLVPDDAVVCVDVGNNAYSFGRYLRQDVLMSGYLWSIGFALPAVVGQVPLGGGRFDEIGVWRRTTRRTRME